MEAARWARSKARPLKCSRPEAALPGGSHSSQSDRAAASSVDTLCRICWDVQDADDEGGKLVAPCACSGSMRYVHVRCLTQWQRQLRLQKGPATSRRCDVCKAAWGKAHMPVAAAGDWRLLLRDVMRSMPWPAVLEFWKFSVLAVGTAQGLQAGVAGFRTGMAWASNSSRYNLQGLARWAPEMAMAAGAVPPLKVPMAVCVAALVGGLAAEVALLSMLCAYAGSVTGFLSGISDSLLCTLQLGSGTMRQGVLCAAALASSALKGAAAAGRLAAPLLLGLLRTLRLARL